MLILVCFIVSSVHANAWSRLHANTDPPPSEYPSERHSGAGAILSTGSSSLFVLTGGRSSVLNFGDTFSMDVATSAVSEASTGPLRHRSCAVPVSLGSAMLLYGGYGAPADDETNTDVTESVVHDDLWRYDSSDESWSEVTGTSGTSPGGRYSAACATDGTALYVYGGLASPSGPELGTLFKYTIGTKTWSALPSGVPASGASMTLVDGKLVVFGGFNATSYELSSVRIFDLGSETWTSPSVTGASLPAGRERHVAVADPEDSAIIVYSGLANGNFLGFEAEGVWKFDLPRARWTKLTPSTDAGAHPGRRAGAVAAVDPSTGNVFVFGGTDGAFMNDIWVYNPPRCSPSCEHSGVCVDDDTCDCTDTGYTGDTCETPVCSPACANSGVCVGPNECDCPSSGLFFGPDCSQRCGDGIHYYNPVYGGEEECDGGACCFSNCTLRAFGTVCRAQALGSDCDVEEVCDGIDGACPPDEFEEGKLCRGSSGPCDRIEYCSGDSAFCPPDAFLGTNVTCRAADPLIPCDSPESCLGSGPGCPADGNHPENTLCNDGDECTSPDVCDASGVCIAGDAICQCNVTADCNDNNPCTTDACDDGTCVFTAGNGGVVCRPSAGLCDVEETCTGSDSLCPRDVVANSGTVCRARGALSGAVEPAEGYAGAHQCDVPEVCDGVNPTCPDDVVQPAGISCRARTGLCDEAERCDGTSKFCPPDAVLPADTVCRASPANNEVCNPVEVCDGTSAACPANTHAPVDTVCDDGNSCTSPDRCLAGGVCYGPEDLSAVGCAATNPGVSGDVEQVGTCTAADLAACDSECSPNPTDVCNCTESPTVSATCVDAASQGANTCTAVGDDCSTCISYGSYCGFCVQVRQDGSRVAACYPSTSEADCAVVGGVWNYPCDQDVNRATVAPTPASTRASGNEPVAQPVAPGTDLGFDLGDTSKDGPLGLGLGSIQGVPIDILLIAGIACYCCILCSTFKTYLGLQKKKKLARRNSRYELSSL